MRAFSFRADQILDPCASHSGIPVYTLVAGDYHESPTGTSSALGMIS